MRPCSNSLRSFTQSCWIAMINNQYDESLKLQWNLYSDITIIWINWNIKRSIRRSHLEYSIKWNGFLFIRCSLCSDNSAWECGDFALFTLTNESISQIRRVWYKRQMNNRHKTGANRLISDCSVWEITGVWTCYLNLLIIFCE